MTDPKLCSSRLIAAMAALSLAFVGLVAPNAARATSGDLDPTFSGDGFLTASFGPLTSTSDVADAVTVDQQGRILVAGSTSKGNDFAILRYQPDGSLDPSWSFDGRVRTDFGGSDGAVSLAVDDQGKVVVAGTTTDSSGHSQFALARYMPHGRFDDSFSADGKVTTDFREAPAQVTNARATSLAIDSLGRIVVAGRVDFGEYTFGVARYLPNGALDTSFSGDGKTAFVFDESASNNLDTPYAVATDSQDRVVLAGGAADVGQSALARLTPDGSFDTTFSSDGKVITDFLGGISDIRSIAIDSQNRIVAAGRGYYADGSGDPTDTAGFSLARYLPGGALDPTFSPKGVAGTLTTHVGSGQAVAHGVAIDSLGRIVAVGESAPGAPSDDFAVARYEPSGLPDTTFSGDGQVTTHIGSERYPTGAFAGAVDAQDRIVAAGVARRSVDIAVARYLGDG